MTQLSNATASKIIAAIKSPAEDADHIRRRSEDFKFMVLCESKGNMGMYRVFRDKSLDPPKEKP